MPIERTGHSKNSLPRTQQKTTNGYLHIVNIKIRLIIFFTAKDGEALYSQQKKRPRADCGSDHELLIVKFRLKLKKMGKTTGPFRYDLNQIPYNFTVEVTNRFKELDLIDRVPEELWTEVCDIVQDDDQSHPQEKEMQKGKMVD